MKFTILLKCEEDSSAPLIVSQIERTGPLNAATLGLTLAESKCLLTGVRQKLAETQFQCYANKQWVFVSGTGHSGSNRQDRRAGEMGLP